MLFKTNLPADTPNIRRGITGQRVNISVVPPFRIMQPLVAHLSPLSLLSSK